MIGMGELTLYLPRTRRRWQRRPLFATGFEHDLMVFAADVDPSRLLVHTRTVGISRERVSRESDCH